MSWLGRGTSEHPPYKGGAGILNMTSAKHNTSTVGFAALCACLLFENIVARLGN